jgi:hypothetical protein
MRTARLRYTGFGLLLLVVIGGLLTAWLQLSHIFFSLIAITVAAVAALFAYFLDGWRQTTTESLTARGIYPEAVGEFSITEPGLSRDWGGMVPSAVGRRTPRTRVKRAKAASSTRARRAAALRATAPGSRPRLSRLPRLPHRCRNPRGTDRPAGGAR